VGLVARRFVLGRAARLVIVTARAPDGTTQELRLIVLLEALATPSFAAFGRVLLRRALRGLGTSLPTLAVTFSVLPVAISVAEAPVVAPEGPILAVAFIAVAFVLSTLTAAMLMRRLMLLKLRLLEDLVEHVFPIVVAKLFPALGSFRPRARAAAVHGIAGLIELLAIGHDDADVVLGMLEIVLGQHRIAGGLSITRERKILLRYMRWRAPDLHLGTIGLEAPRKRVLALAIVATAAATILLSLPHWLIGSHFSSNSVP
jgi:hypothetical protein